METKYLRIFTFIFWKKKWFFLKKNKKTKKEQKNKKNEKEIKNYNFKGITAILKKISLMGHKVV